MVLSPGRGKARGKGDAALIGDPLVTFQRTQARHKRLFRREPDLIRRTADAFFMITTPVIISVVCERSLGIIK
jgi:hypothetical protein